MEINAVTDSVWYLGGTQRGPTMYGEGWKEPLPAEVITVTFRGESNTM